MCPLVWRGVDHQKEALLGGRELRDIVIGMSPSNMLLHGAKAFLLKDRVPVSDSLSFFFFLFLIVHYISLNPGCLLDCAGNEGTGDLSPEKRARVERDTHSQTSLAAIGAVIVGQRADDLVVGIRDRKRAGQRRSWWHGLHVSFAVRRGRGIGGSWSKHEQR